MQTVEYPPHQIREGRQNGPISRKYAHLLFQTGSLDVSALLDQISIQLPYFLYDLLAVYAQASSRTS